MGSKYSSAKAISSDMLFGNEKESAPDANLSRFQGSSSISSADYFGRQETTPAGRGLQTPDMDDVKESVRMGVTKVAGRLSGLASGALSSIQVMEIDTLNLSFVVFEQLFLHCRTNMDI